MHFRSYFSTSELQKIFSKDQDMVVDAPKALIINIIVAVSRCPDLYDCFQARYN